MESIKLSVMHPLHRMVSCITISSTYNSQISRTDRRGTTPIGLAWRLVLKCACIFKQSNKNVLVELSQVVI